MSRSTVTEKIAKLIALAGNNPNENEARTAAYMACKLMNEHKLSVGGTADDGAAALKFAAAQEMIGALREALTSEGARADRAERRLTASETALATARLEILALRAELEQARKAAPAPEAPKAAPAPEAPKAAPKRAARRPFLASNAPKMMSARYAGECACCGGAFPEGTPIAYEGRTRTASHQECYRAAQSSAA